MYHVCVTCQALTDQFAQIITCCLSLEAARYSAWLEPRVKAGRTQDPEASSPFPEPIAHVATCNKKTI